MTLLRTSKVPSLSSLDTAMSTPGPPRLSAETSSQCKTACAELEGGGKEEAEHVSGLAQSKINDALCPIHTVRVKVSR